MIFTREEYPILLEKDIGCAVPDTWFPHVKHLLDHMEWLSTASPEFSSLRVLQIKEKFGSLRVYTEFNPVVQKDSWQTEEYYRGFLRGIIDMTGFICANTCVECGSHEEILNTTKGTDGGWVAPRCPNHR